MKLGDKILSGVLAILIFILGYQIGWRVATLREIKDLQYLQELMKGEANGK